MLAQALGIEADLDILRFQDLLHGGRHVLVIPRDEARSLFDDRDLVAEPPVHLAELQADVAAANHDEMLRQEVHLHHAGVGQVRHVAKRHVGDEGAGADVDEDALRLERLVTHRNRVGAGEARMPLVDGCVLECLEGSFETLARLAGDGVLPGLDPGHVQRHLTAEGDAVVDGAPSHVGGAGAGDQRLRRDAAGVYAGAAELVPLDDGGLPAGGREAMRQGWAGLAGADDQGVVFGRHGSISQDAGLLKKAERGIIAKR